MTALDQIGHLSDIPVYVDVELARKIMTVGEILSLEEGSVLNMTRSAGENIDLLIGGAPVASGEIVIIEEAVGVRITDFAEED
ncbi:MAG: FliM/FliN family flagellar motor switch protein [Bryobacterales bacterium]|nr:FliM/FliN family flagellar motor switch protein [Bryobacterales bacterium]MBV9400131.1 FliM/FliN family flagellar motor switch protein [Bryobacterales bacterium]